MTQKKLRALIIIPIVCLALAVALNLSGGKAQASPMPQDGTPSAQPCSDCHADIQEAWFNGAHSSTRTDHVLQESMNCTACHPKFEGGQGAQPPANFASTPAGNMRDNNCVACHTTGYDEKTRVSKSYGITCEACHTPVQGHPDRDMPISSSAKACGACHSDARFNWDSWQNSRHYRENMNCAECHDPHSASLRNVGADGVTGKSGLCLSCHEASEHMSPYSVHGRMNVSCVDCHLGEKSGVDDFHVVPNHSFKPNIETCNNCHAATLHRPAMPSADLPAADIRLTPTHAAPTPQPTHVEAPSRAGLPLPADDTQLWWLALAVIAGLMGLIAGVMVMLLLPLLQKGKTPLKKES